MEMGKQTGQFFTSYIDEFGRKQYRLKSLEQYSREHGTQEQPGKKYFAHNTLPEIIRAAPMPRASNKPGDIEKEMANRTAFIDFVQGLLNLNPIERWSPQQAKLHPFITGEKFTGPFVPPGAKTVRANSTGGPTVVDPKRPYGGLVPSQPKGSRAYTDAASYNQQLAQHQAYTAQAATQQAANNAMRNPYAQPTSYQREDSTVDYSQPNTSVSQQPRLQHQASTGALPTSHSYPNPPPNTLRSVPVANNPNPPSVSYYPASRNRANTINQMDIVPPQIARIANMGVESAIGRNTLTPVLNREDAIREWERRQSGKTTTTHTTYPQLEYLQQQAELPSWSSSTGSRGYGIAPPPPAANMYQSTPTTVMMDGQTTGLRDVTMSATNPRLAGARYDQSLQTALPSPPQAYSGSSAGGQRYPQTYQQQSSTRPQDSFDQYNSPQGHQYQQSYGASSNGPQPQQQRFATANVTSPQTNSHSFYPASTVPSGTVTARNPFSSNSPSMNTPTQSKDGRRVNEMDIWPR
jgi:dual specificity protein kinase YAK1